MKRFLKLLGVAVLYVAYFLGGLVFVGTFFDSAAPHSISLWLYGSVLFFWVCGFVVALLYCAGVFAHD